jgi:dTDP-glucose 4,6-dehydratase
MNYLVTGGAGFIGSHLVELILKTNSKVLVLDKLTYASSQWTPPNLNANFKFIKVDIAKRNELFHYAENIREFLGNGFSIFHLAAESHVDRSINSADEFIHTNVLGTQVMLDFAKQSKAFRFLHISTDEVYGSLEKGEATETSSLNPSSAYSASKAASDLVALAHHKTFGTDIIVTRCVNNFGPRQSLEKFIPRAISRALKGLPIPIYGKGVNIREWIYVVDHCKILLMLMQEGESGQIYNIGTRERRTNLEIVQLILRTLNLPVVIDHVPDRLGHDFRYALDSSRISGWLGKTPLLSIEEGLKHTIAYYEEYAHTKEFEKEYALMENSYVR